MSIGTRIIQIRNQKNISQRQLSERTGIAGSYLSRIENRRLEAGPKTLRKIADALGVGLSDLFQESPTAQGVSPCVITASGNCIMELLENRQRKGAYAGAESYTPRQLQLLRMANYLIQSGNTRVLDALELLFSSLISSPDTRPAPKGLVTLGPRAAG
ncbi:MAG: helix-turn-helix transcriptional regulator [Acidobacteria bacterium]|nr:helix-turn-helix transcriptional regulator [Acidobacteriota bacterium]